VLAVLVIRGVPESHGSSILFVNVTVLLALAALVYAKPEIASSWAIVIVCDEVESMDNLGLTVPSSEAIVMLHLQ